MLKNLNMRNKGMFVNHSQKQKLFLRREKKTEKHTL